MPALLAALASAFLVGSAAASGAQESLPGAQEAQPGAPQALPADRSAAAPEPLPAPCNLGPAGALDPEPPPVGPLTGTEEVTPAAPMTAPASGGDSVATRAAAAEPGPEANPYATIVWDESPDIAHAPAGPAAVQIGEASWYGADFHGLTTASGEIYDMHAPTVAHPTWPFGGIVHIHNLRNGRSALARINDRGPYARGRILDCSYAVAHRLGFVNRGATEVQVTLLDADREAWTRFDPSLAPRRSRPRPPQPVEVAVALASVEDAAPAALAPDAVRAGTGGDDAPARAALLRAASVLPLPTVVHAWHRLCRWLLGAPETRSSRWARCEARLEGLGLRAVVRWFAGA